jgi:hypothetical protein
VAGEPRAAARGGHPLHWPRSGSQDSLTLTTHRALTSHPAPLRSWPSSSTWAGRRPSCGLRPPPSPTWRAAGARRRQPPPRSSPAPRPPPRRAPRTSERRPPWGGAGAVGCRCWVDTGCALWPECGTTECGRGAACMEVGKVGGLSSRACFGLAALGRDHHGRWSGERARIVAADGAGGAFSGWRPGGWGLGLGL